MKKVEINFEYTTYMRGTIEVEVPDDFTPEQVNEAWEKELEKYDDPETADESPIMGELGMRDIEDEFSLLDWKEVKN